ncbi:biotin-dependent carboxyltransferase family protein [Pokkaliibacter sp. CJK22405]|uniref:5-oxoprolinase subunit C family protein n=1 Tax=Pokkaliibacter sp. CJK22405 TaxID=3384615 RepID=UPI0039851F21
MSQLRIIDPGRLSMVQDQGRRGVMAAGLSVGGAVDGHAAAWANHVLGNDPQSALIEVTLGGLVVEFCEATSFSLTGADCGALLDGRPVSLWQTQKAQAGEVLKLGFPRAGLRSYLAVAGGFLVTKSLGGSCTTVMREGTGGLCQDGSSLKAQDALSYSPGFVEDHAMSTRFIPDYQQTLTLRVILGAQQELFSNEALSRFFSQTYRVSPKSDRMGVRLEGAPVSANKQGLVSEGIALGAIQVPADGQPIILMQDRQTIGGYPKLGAVLPLDLYALAQRPPGATLRFQPVALFEAQGLMQTFLRFFH